MPPAPNGFALAEGPSFVAGIKLIGLDYTLGKGRPSVGGELVVVQPEEEASQTRESVARSE
jgi:hypothetical protein